MPEDSTLKNIIPSISNLIQTHYTLQILVLFYFLCFSSALNLHSPAIRTSIHLHKGQASGVYTLSNGDHIQWRAVHIPQNILQFLFTIHAAHFHLYTAHLNRQLYFNSNDIYCNGLSDIPDQKPQHILRPSNQAQNGERLGKIRYWAE